MVRVLIDDIFKSEAQTLVNTVNCVGIMGKGIALEFKNRFQDMFDDYAARCERGEVKLGFPYLFRRLFPPWVLLFPTKDHWRSVSSLSAIERGLAHLTANYKQWEITSLAVPPLGCGLGELDWNIVGPTLYRHLQQLDIPVELYAPFNTPHSQLTPEFLEHSHATQTSEVRNGEPKIEPGLIVLLEVLWRLQLTPYHWPVGRTTFQKLAYFGTQLGLDTGLEYRRASFGPFAEDLKSKLTRLVNNGLIEENQVGQMFAVTIGKTYVDARNVYAKAFEASEQLIERLKDLFCRMNTHEAELAATVHFARETMKLDRGATPTEEQLLNEVMEWKKRHRPPYDRREVASTVRNLASLGWLDVNPSESVSKELSEEFIL